MPSNYGSFNFPNEEFTINLRVIKGCLVVGSVGEGSVVEESDVRGDREMER